MPIKCPKCNSIIPNINILISEDFGRCESCNYDFRISQHLPSDIPQSERLNLTKIKYAQSTEFPDPPSGCWIRQDNYSLIIGATTHSWGGIFICICAIIILTFGLFELFKVLLNDFDLYLFLFTIPFFVLFGVFCERLIFCITGKEEVKLNAEEGTIFSGAGSYGTTHFFVLKKFHSVTVETYAKKEFRRKKIILHAQPRLEFGYYLSNTRRNYIVKVLEQVLIARKNGHNLFKVDLTKHIIDP
ncbi:hypothetical protein OAK19_01395 [Aureispira]|nr:hypothetical protein [Aureispira sp.]